MRSSAGVRRQSGKAAAAAATAAATSEASDKGARAIGSPVAGLNTSSHSVAEDSRHSPLMKLGSFVTGGAATLINFSVLNRLGDCGLFFGHRGERRFKHVQGLFHLRVSDD